MLQIIDSMCSLWQNIGLTMGSYSALMHYTVMHSRNVSKIDALEPVIKLSKCDAQVYSYLILFFQTNLVM